MSEVTKKNGLGKRLSLREALWHVYAFQPCTLRGILAIILATVAVRTLAIAEFDLVANILGWSILALLGITFLSVLFLRFRIAAILEATSHISTLSVISKRPIPAGISLRNSSLPPYFALELRRVFAHPGVESPVHIVTGYQGASSSRILVDSLRFPHRGRWKLNFLECRISDALGFCALRWRIPLDSIISVSAETYPIESLPIVASSHRAGEDLTSSSERTGDLFDIKTYDPSDGIKRILWKTYARSGELVSRRPEPASIPDGELALFLLARREEDVVAGAVQDYIEQLRANDIEVLFGTDTLSIGDMESSQDAAYVMKPDEIQDAIDGDVWHDSLGTGQGVSEFIESLSERGRAVEQIVFFASAENQSWIEATMNALKSFHSKAIIAVVDSDRQAVEDLRKKLSGQGVEVLAVLPSMRLA